jgi:hypothetical protein
MNRLLLLAASALIVVPGCARPEAVAAPPEETAIVFAEPERETIVQAPNDTMSVVVGGDGEVLLSAGFLRRSDVARVDMPSYVAWAPDSKGFFINDSGSAAWSTMRLFAINPRGMARESAVVREAVIAELARLNGCASAPAPDVTTHGMAWADGGAQVYVLAQVRRQTGACVWKDVSYIVSVVEVGTGQLLETAEGEAARTRYPSLPWAP